MSKRLFIAALFLCFLASTYTIQAQDLKINTQAGYVFDDRFDSRYDDFNFYYGKLKGGFQWGGGLEYMVDEDYGIEVSYIRQKTTVPLNYYYYGRQFQNFNAGINYILLGSNRYIDLDSKMVKPFVGFQAGLFVAHWSNPYSSNPDNVYNGSGNITKFAWSAKMGTELWFSDAVGLKLQAQLLSAVQSFGGGFYFGTGGTGAGLSANSSIFQFGLGGGLTFKLATDKKK